MKKITVILSALLISTTLQVSAFCGFYLAKADASLFNKASQVIIVRDGNKTVITMSSDFSGDVKDFAMVVPVPEVLKKENIRVADRAVFDKMDAYSAPRLVEYHDPGPCNQWLYDSVEKTSVTSMMKNKASKEEEDKDLGVKIEAKYTVGEYDILILSADQSAGLEKWLTANGYKIPSGASEVLEPYIKSNLKFFVAKVNLKEHKDSGYSTLRPLQMTFNSNKFMLPIRLGMANATGNQDLIVYALTKTGRVETTNYRTVKIPTDKNVPEFVQSQFGQFYADLYNRTWTKEGGNAVFLEYSWDVSPSNYMKCDPCTGTPPIMSDLKEAGVSWVTTGSDPKWGTTVQGQVFFTRLHVTYNRQNFPQDLVFQETPNRESFQGRYIITHPAPGPYSCSGSNEYLVDLQKRRQHELDELVDLTGWDISSYLGYPSEYSQFIKPEKDKKDKKKKEGRSYVPAPRDHGSPGQGLALAAMGALFLLMVLASLRRRHFAQQ